MNLDFTFVGPQRTGTTWIYQHLVSHKELCFPKDVKETMFFDRNYNKGLEWYSWHFTESKRGQKCGEIAPTYFDDEEVPERIKKYFPDCKIIISLRDPVEKAKSLYQHHYQKGRVRKPFREAIKTRPDILTSGYYKEHIERWFDYFDEEQVLVISMEEIKKTPKELLPKIYYFLEVDGNHIHASINREQVNTAQRPHFSGLARMGSKLVTKLHSMRLHWVVNFAKVMGLEKLFFKKSDKKPGLTKNEREFLEKEYIPHVEYVNKKFEHISL